MITTLGPNGKKIEDVSVEDFDRVYAINVRGSFNVTKHSIPHMLKNNYGRVLLIASIAGKEGNAVRPQHPNYSISSTPSTENCA
jgi:NAD(P)-dependent dehydrogenase (short-subunit alcohol dehydrogenase family)